MCELAEQSGVKVKVNTRAAHSRNNHIYLVGQPRSWGRRSPEQHSIPGRPDRKRSCRLHDTAGLSRRGRQPKRRAHKSSRRVTEMGSTSGGKASNAAKTCSRRGKRCRARNAMLFIHIPSTRLQAVPDHRPAWRLAYAADKQHSTRPTALWQPKIVPGDSMARGPPERATIVDLKQRVIQHALQVHPHRWHHMTAG